jgi:hypothetical protein
MDPLKDFVAKSIRETISASSSLGSKSLDDIAGELAKDLSDDDFFSYHRIVKVGSSPFVSYCQIRFKASEEQIQSVVSEINKSAGIDAPASSPSAVDVNPSTSFDFAKLSIEFVKRQYDLKRGISGFEYLIKTILGATGVRFLMLFIDSGAWRPWFVLWWIFIPFVYFSSVQRINKLGFGFGVTYLSIAAILGTAITQFLRFKELEVQQIWYVLDVIYAFFVLAGILKWVKRTLEEAQNE